MANLSDFNPDTDMVAKDELYEIDKWVLNCYNSLVKTVNEAYNKYEFHIVYHEINNFCTVELSKLYIDITKDRIYVEKKDSHARRCAQTTMYTILSGLTRMLAPLIVFTAEEIWKAMPHASSDNKESVFLNSLPKYDEKIAFSDIEQKWDRLFGLRDDVMKSLELARADKFIGKSLDAKVTIYTEDSAIYDLLSSFDGELATVYIVSSASVVLGKAPEGATSYDSGIGVKVDIADGERCDRCWLHSTEGEHTEDGFLCARCAKIVKE